MASRRRPVNVDGTRLDIWTVKPFQNLYSAFGAVQSIAVQIRPLGLITGAAGVGKTFAASVYAHNTPNTIVVTVPPRDVLTPRLLLDEIAVAIGLEPAGYRTKSAAFLGIADQLADNRPYLIVDEADRLRPSNADMLRELAELSGAPLCLLGCPFLEAVLARVPATHHRIGYRHHARPCDINDIRGALRGRKLSDGRQLQDSVIDAIWDVSRGNLRHVQSLIQVMAAAVDDRTGLAKDITPDFVRQINDQTQRAAA